jgi:protein-arginine kinase activator protein McsA
LALRFNAPIYTYKNILDKAGIYLKANSTETDKDSQEIDDILSNPETLGIKKAINRLYIKHSLQELSELLDQAVLQEDYEKAAKIRDEISKRES